MFLGRFSDALQEFKRVRGGLLASNPRKQQQQPWVATPPTTTPPPTTTTTTLSSSPARADDASMLLAAAATVVLQYSGDAIFLQQHMLTDYVMPTTVFKAPLNRQQPRSDYNDAVFVETRQKLNNYIDNKISFLSKKI